MQEEYLLDVFDYITASADDILGLNESQVGRNFFSPPVNFRQLLRGLQSISDLSKSTLP